MLLVALLLTDTMGFLSTDTGGKLATLEAMNRSGTLVPDLGYWAVAADPDGTLYPMWSTQLVGESWVNVTTLPMILIALPLYNVGGALAAGLVPLVGTVLAALGARGLARSLGHEGHMAFWLVGLASPVTVYALDFWEHSLGVALVVWAVVGVLAASREDGAWWFALLAGLAFGVAASMRQEALVYGFVSGCALGLRLLFATRVATVLARGAALSVGFLSAWLANAWLEAALIGAATRTDRSQGTFARFGDELGLRAEEAIVTLGGVVPSARPLYLVLAIITVGLLVELGRRASRGSNVGPVAVACASIGLLLAMDVVVGGLGFVPGLAATTPVAVLGLSQVWREGDHRFVAAIAVGSLPLIFAVQYTGGALPQWGGRYLLPTGTLLLVLASVVLDNPKSRDVLRAVAAGGALVTLLGVAWTIERSHDYADTMRILADRPEQALVFSDSFMARSGGVLVLDEQWLAAVDEAGRLEAADALVALGIEDVGFVQPDIGAEPLVLPGWEVVSTETVPFISDLNLLVVTQTAPETTP